MASPTDTEMLNWVARFVTEIKWSPFEDYNSSYCITYYDSDAEHQHSYGSTLRRAVAKAMETNRE